MCWSHNTNVFMPETDSIRQLKWVSNRLSSATRAVWHPDTWQASDYDCIYTNYHLQALVSVCWWETSTRGVSCSSCVSADEELTQAVCHTALVLVCWWETSTSFCQCVVVHRKKVVCCLGTTGVPSKHSVLLVIVIAHDLGQKMNRVWGSEVCLP